jgi:hypothetical protein
MLIEETSNFWFTAAVVGFNGYLITNSEVPDGYALTGAALVSLHGLHIVLTRWIAGARTILHPPDHRTASCRDRWSYTLLEVRKYLVSLPYILAELSGTSFYLLLISVSFAGVLCKHIHW